MKQVEDYPKEGQFVAVWQNNNGVWSGVFNHEDGVLHEYNSPEDSWDSYHEPYFALGGNHSVIYFVEN